MKQTTNHNIPYPNGVIHYPKPEEEPKGYLHWNNAKSVMPGIDDVCPGNVKVYINLKLNRISLLNKRTNLLYCHVRNVRIKNAKFVVHSKKNAVNPNVRKKVNAYITGSLVDVDMRYFPFYEEGWKKVLYPYSAKYFIDETSSMPVHEARDIVFYDLDGGSIWYKNFDSQKKKPRRY